MRPEVLSQLASDSPVVAIIGNPLGHTLSPALHNAAFEALGMDWRYVALEMQEAEVLPLLDAVRNSNVRGLNVTIPFKTLVVPALDEVDELATVCGAVNTIRFDQGRSIGHNTDCTGFVRSLKVETKADPAGADVVILGAGGVARAAAAGLANEGAGAITLWGRTPGRAAALVADLERSFPSVEWKALAGEQDEQLKRSVINADIVINATPVGMYPHAEGIPIPAAWLTGRQLVADLIYRPAKTRLLEAAENNGAQVLSGVGTFIQQAAEAFRIWTGKEAPTDVMQEVLRRELGYSPVGL